MQEKPNLGTEKLKVKIVFKLYKLQSVSEIISEIDYFSLWKTSYISNPRLLKLEVIPRNWQFSTTKE